MERLDRQRQPSKVHARKNSRWYRRGYETVPHEVWGDSRVAPTPPPNGGEAPAAPPDGSLAPGETIWWHRTSDKYRGVSVGPPASGDLSLLVMWGDTPVSGASLYSGGAPINATAALVFPNGTWTSTLHDGAAETDPVLSTHTWTVTDGVAVDLQVEHPENFSIADIEAWVDGHPDMADEVLSHEEAAASPRSTLVSWLQGFISDRDEGHIP